LTQPTPNALRDYCAALAVALTLCACNFGAGSVAAASLPPQQSDASEPRPYSKSVSVVLEDVEHLLSSLGIIAAGIWAYYNYFRGRTYRPRLEPEISTSMMGDRDCCYLMIRVTVKNVGLSRVDIKQAGTVLTVFAGTVPAPLTGPRELEWLEVRFVTVLSKHAWIEPGEEIEDEHFLALPAIPFPAYRLDLRITSPVGQTWNAGTVATRKADSALRA
jgi:hypothetical protein